MKKNLRGVTVFVLLALLIPAAGYGADLPVRKDSRGRYVHPKTGQPMTAEEYAQMQRQNQLSAMQDKMDKLRQPSVTSQSNETGTRDCSGKSEDQDYSDCRNGAEDTNIDDATETHRLKPWFLGEQWIVSGIKTQSPAYSAAKQATSTQKTVNQKLDPRHL